MGKMDEQELRELIIRLDERVVGLQKDVTAIKQSQQCFTHHEKILTLEKIAWTALIAHIAWTVQFVWNTVSHNVATGG